MTFKKTENRWAGKIGGKRQRGSGNSWRPTMKADAVSDDILLESKETDKSEITLHSDDLTKLSRQAIRVRKEPVMGLRIGLVYLTLKKTFDDPDVVVTRTCKVTPSMEGTVFGTESGNWFLEVDHD